MASKTKRLLEGLLCYLTEGRDLVAEGLLSHKDWLSAMTEQVKEALREQSPEAPEGAEIANPCETCDCCHAHQKSYAALWEQHGQSSKQRDALVNAVRNLRTDLAVANAEITKLTLERDEQSKQRGDAELCRDALREQLRIMTVDRDRYRGQWERSSAAAVEYDKLLHETEAKLDRETKWHDQTANERVREREELYVRLKEAIQTGKQFEQDARKHFDQSCQNLNRANDLQKKLEKVEADYERADSILDELHEIVLGADWRAAEPFSIVEKVREMREQRTKWEAAAQRAFRRRDWRRKLYRRQKTRADVAEKKLGQLNRRARMIAKAARYRKRLIDAFYAGEFDCPYCGRLTGNGVCIECLHGNGPIMKLKKEIDQLRRDQISMRVLAKAIRESPKDLRLLSAWRWLQRLARKHCSADGFVEWRSVVSEVEEILETAKRPVDL